jgi:integrase
LRYLEWQDTSLVCLNRAGKPIDHNNLYHQDFKAALGRAGLPSTFRFHDLRHTCATQLLSKNVNPKIIQELLRHANISQTMDTYSHVLPNMQDEAAASMEVDWDSPVSTDTLTLRDPGFFHSILLEVGGTPVAQR